MALHKLGKDPESKSGGSPTIYLDDEKDSYVVQGWRIEDEDRLKQLDDIPGHETVVEIPRRMVQFFLEMRRDEGTDL
ncbi:hypothetical protein [Streptomyces sp. NBC_01481]|uniref:hypothetical protein n=1 Tax=Streptomyces sp. NBC_01481 TaxID=2975869 RepID=UPI00225522A1|nr:hypothetical protein [Streptomyces sp. NBC_01481]MCX4582541.1 hypothetical protein [Streptomyces sp. NBC_01481]